MEHELSGGFQTNPSGLEVKCDAVITIRATAFQTNPSGLEAVTGPDSTACH